MSGPVYRALRGVLAALLACVCLAGCQKIGQPSSAQPGFDAEGAAELRAVIASGRLPELRASDFRAEQDEVTDLYLRSGHQPAWIGDGEATPQALAVVRLFQRADEKALNPEDYDASLWKSRLERLRAAPLGPEAARVDVALTVCLVRYIRALHFGRVNPRPGGPQLDIGGRAYAMAEFLQERVIHAPDPESALAAVEPRSPGYRQALAMLRAYRQMAALDEGGRLPVPEKPIPRGKGYAGAARLALLLRLLGDLPGDVQLPTTVDAYDGALADAVKRFQVRHGQTPDGILDAELVNALNVPLSRRVRQLELTLERWRWLPHSSAQPRIVVNLPEFRLHAFDADNRKVFERKIIVGGSRGRRSPVFEKTMNRVVFRPYWDVPSKIQHHEIVPHLQKDREYLSKHHYQVLSHEGEVVSEGAVDEGMLAAIRSGRVRVRQRPGTANALGLVKFVFPNEQNIFMHDTDSPQLFSRERRDLSHGCIRVEGADELAAWVLNGNPGWDLERVRAAMKEGKNNVSVRLAQPVSVVIFYGTVAFDQEGRAFFFNDLYGYDGDLDRTLARYGQAAGATEAKLSGDSAR